MPKSKLIPRLAIGEPYQPEQRRPQLQIPSSMTAYRDDTGEPVFRFGDSPLGPETVTVTPPGGQQQPPRAALSMAKGGSALVGDPIRGGTTPTVSGGGRWDQRIPEEDQWVNDGTLERLGVYRGWPEGSIEAEQAATQGGGNGPIGGYFGDDGQWVRFNPEAYERLTGLSFGGPPQAPDPRHPGIHSMQYGGQALVGTGVEDSRSRELRQRRAMLNANRDVGRLQQVAQARTMRANEDQIYGQLSVATPNEVDVQPGQSVTNPLARASLRNPADYLADQFEEENLRAAEVQNAQRDNVERGFTVPGRRARLQVSDFEPGAAGGGRGGKEPEDNWTPREYTDPLTGTRQLLHPYEIAIREAQNEEQMAQMADPDALPKPPRGFEYYEDPFNPSARPRLVSPAQKAMLDRRDKERQESEYEQQYGQPKTELSNFTKSELITYAVSDAVSPQELVEELQARGFSRGEINALLREIAARKKKAAGTEVQYPEGFGELEEDEVEEEEQPMPRLFSFLGR